MGSLPLSLILCLAGGFVFGMLPALTGGECKSSHNFCNAAHAGPKNFQAFRSPINFSIRTLHPYSAIPVLRQ